MDLFANRGFDLHSEVSMPFNEKISPDNRTFLLLCSSPPIVSAARGYNYQIFKLLVDHGCDLHSKGYFGMYKGQSYYETNVFGAAMYHRRNDVARFLLDRSEKPDVNFKTVKKPLPLEMKHAVLEVDIESYTPLMLVLLPLEFESDTHENDNLL